MLFSEITGISKDYSPSTKYSHPHDTIIRLGKIWERTDVEYLYRVSVFNTLSPKPLDGGSLRSKCHLDIVCASVDFLRIE